MICVLQVFLVGMNVDYKTEYSLDKPKSYKHFDPLNDFFQQIQELFANNLFFADFDGALNGALRKVR